MVHGTLAHSRMKNSQLNIGMQCALELFSKKYVYLSSEWYEIVKVTKQ